MTMERGPWDLLAILAEIWTNQIDHSAPIHLPGARCLSCGRLEFPGRWVCPACDNPMEPAGLPERGKVDGTTTVYYPVPGSLRVPPYQVASVTFAGGLNVLGPLVGVDGIDVPEGTEVEVRLAILDDRIGYEFQFLGNEEAPMSLDEQGGQDGLVAERSQQRRTGYA